MLMVSTLWGRLYRYIQFFALHLHFFAFLLQHASWQWPREYVSRHAQVLLASVLVIMQVPVTSRAALIPGSTLHP